MELILYTTLSITREEMQVEPVPKKREPVSDGCYLPILVEWFHLERGDELALKNRLWCSPKETFFTGSLYLKEIGFL